MVGLLLNLHYGNRCSGMIQSRQLLWGFMDMTFATAVGKIDTASIFNRLRLEITEVAGINSALELRTALS